MGEKRVAAVAGLALLLALSLARTHVEAQRTNNSRGDQMTVITSEDKNTLSIRSTRFL